MSTLQKGSNATNPPRQRHTGPNFMDGSVISTFSQSASEQYQFFQLPAQCFVIRGFVKGSQKSGVSGQAIFKLGTSKGDSTFGTYTVSGGAVLSGNVTFVGPKTLSSSGGANSATNPQFWPVIATIQSGATATTSLSMYVMLEYLMPGNIGDNTGQGL